MGLRNLCVIAVGLVVGCGSPRPSDAPTPCVQQPFRAELHVDAVDNRKIWATHYATGQDYAVKPRPPDVFVTDPSRPTTVLTGQGDVFSVGGGIIQTACVDAAARTIFVGPEDVADPNRAPN